MAREDAILSVGVDVNVRAAMASVDSLQKHMSAQMKAISKATEGMGKKGAQAAAAAAKHFDEWKGSIEDLEEATSDLQKAYKQLEKQEKDLEKMEEAASKKRLASLREQKKAILDSAKAQKRSRKGKESGGGGGGGRGGPSGSVDIDKKSRGQLAGDIKTAFEAAGSIFRKDLRGSWDKLSNRFGERAGKGLTNWGKKASIAGERMKTRGAAMGGMGGGVMKAIGGLLGKFGPMIKLVMSLGPILMGLSSAITGIVTLLIDAEGRAKEFNKQILEGAQSAEFLRDAGWDASSAFYDMSDALKAVRDEANSMKILTEYGIKKDEYIAAMQGFKDVGVSLADMRKEAEDSGQAIGDVTTNYVRTAVTSARALGVPISEIIQMQGEMFQDVGMGVDTVRTGFAQMTRTATESGIATNKFFAMIRNVSQDLALYNNRMGDAVKLLGKLGKVMNPRNAQQFMQWAMGALKGMDQDSRLKLRLLAGDKTKGRLTKDLERKQKGLAGDIGKVLGRSADEVANILQKGGLKEREKLFDELRKQAPKQAGALVQAANEMRMDQGAMGKGVWGEAAAMRNASAGTSLDIMRDALKKFGGGETLAEGIGTLGQDKIAQLLGLSEEQVRQMAGLEMHLQGQGMLLADQLRQQGIEGEAAQKLRDAGIDVTEENKAAILAQLDAGTMDMGALMETLSDEEKAKAEQDAKTIEQLTAEQTQHTITIADYLDQLLNFLMNQLYNIMVDIWDTIQQGFFGKEGKEQREARKSVYKSGNMELIKAFEELEKEGKGKVDYNALRGIAGDTVGAGIVEKLEGGDKESVKAIEDFAQKQLKPEEMLQAMKMAGVSGEDLMKMEAGLFKEVEEVVPQGTTYGAAPGAAQIVKKKVAREDALDYKTLAKEIGISEKEYRAALGKMIWTGSSERGVELAGLANKELGRGKKPSEKQTEAKEDAKAKVKEEKKQEAKSSGEKPPSAQAQASSQAGGPSAQAAVDVSGAGTVQPPSGQPAGGQGSAAGQSKGKDIPATFNGQMMIFGGLAPLMGMMAMEASMAEALEKIHRDLTGRGILIDKNYTSGPLAEAIEKAALDALRVALFEFALYQQADPQELAKISKGKGFDPKTFGKGLLEDTSKTGKLSESLVPKNAAGGLVTGISGGLAIVRPPPGEGMASIGPGERILPAGQSGATNVNVTVAGVGGNELARIIENKVIDGIYEYKRREGFS